MSQSLVHTLRVAAVTGIATLAASCSGCGALEPDERVVAEAATALDVGLAALDAGQDDLAQVRFERVTMLLPAEPSGLANLGLLLLRRQATEEASVMLAEAGTRAPRSVAVLRLRAAAAERRGRVDEAVTHLREALRLEPDDAQSAFALAMTLEAGGAGDQIAEAARVLERLATASRNLAAVVEWVRIAARAGDREAASRAIDRLQTAASSWPAAAVERHAALRTAVDRSDLAAASVAATFLKNVLLPEATYRRDLAVVQPDAGAPIRQLLTVSVPLPMPLPADERLAVAVSRPLVPPGPVADVRLMSPSGQGLTVVMASGAGVWAGGGWIDRSATVTGVTLADVTNDFRDDLILIDGGRLRVLAAREGAGPSAMHVPPGLPPTVQHVWPADIDLDGDLDLVVAAAAGEPVVLRNNTDGTFLLVRPFAGLPAVKAFVWADVDDEGTPDAGFVTGTGSVLVALNERGGRFATSEVTGLTGVVALAGADLKGAARAGGFGLVAADASGRVWYAHLTDAPRTWLVEALPLASVPGITGLHLADLDNSGAVDIVATAAGRTHVRLSGSAGYTALATVPMETRAIGDVNGDGVLELAGLDGERQPAIGTLTLSTTYRSQVFRPRAASLTGDQRINSFGVGGEVDVRAGGRRQRVLISGSQVHVGIGHADRADVVRITWPNGVLQAEFEVPPGAAIRADQRLKGSCPWLFGWDGERMTFLTDVIWRSPLGLRINAQATADVLTTEDRVKIPGGRLTVRDGHYDLRITAELWETHFFDMVALDVIDHPEGTEVFIDERFAIPAPSQDVIVTGSLQPLQAVVDDQGRDVSDIVRQRDDRHLAFAGLGAYQGITRRHAIEFELPATAPRAGPLWLVATGWVHPTDSSVNVAISQGRHAAPSGLALEVEVSPGRFQLVRPNLGFPSGKDKNVLIDLTGVFPAGARRRARLSTNLEIYWDRIAWAVGRPGVTAERRTLPLRQSDLQYRGFSRTVQPNPAVPERPLYELAGTAPRWRDLEGYYTRFGDVRPLLGLVDDRYVILNAGDELLMRFAAAGAPAPGMVRDFVFTGDGWVKDGDFSTSFSRTVLPLPTHASGRYDNAPRTWQDDPVYQRHRRDFDEFHTRWVSPRVR